MMLFHSWTRKLAVGIAIAVNTSFAFGQGEAYPNSMQAGPGQAEYTYPQSPDGYAAAGDSCDGYSGGSCYDGSRGLRARDGLLGGGLLGGGCNSGECGLGGGCGPGCGLGCGCGFGGGGLGSRLNDGCGPLGCDGGTFGDGRSLRSLNLGLRGRLAALLGALTNPYGEGGVASQRWFDFSAEAIILRRSHGAGNQIFTSQGRAPTSPSDFVLSSDSVGLDKYRAGLGLQGNIQVGPGSNVEFAYFGLNKWEESASVTSTTPTLYSFFSSFGTNPFDGFDDPDRSFTHRINYESGLNNGEVNFRRRWAEPSGFLQGSWLAGIRYFQLDEQAIFTAQGENNDTFASNGLRFFEYDTKTKNQLTGFQVGGDVWLNLIPGVKVGTELKAGIFGNHATQNSRITSNSLPAFGIPSIDERASDGRTAYLVQLSSQLIYRLTYAWTLRGSHQLIYVDNVALAPENFNSVPPSLFLPNSAREVQVNTDGEVLYTGFTAGAEYTW
ncbi:MAG: hypothetical protein SGI77_16800 [Pirellulaceae bacterium]|nr:hypothetical protein [Pirellulaceae bacterium]